MEYKQVRITQDYLDKLRKLAVLNKRSMTKHLELLIDKDQQKASKKVK